MKTKLKTIGILLFTFSITTFSQYSEITQVGVNLGIGTTNPTKKLEVNGTVKIKPTISQQTLLLERNPGIAAIKGSGSDGHLVIDAATNAHTVFINQYVSANTVLSGGGGKVGIGTTLPTSKLDVVSNNNRIQLYKNNALALTFQPNNGSASFHIGHTLNNSLQISQGNNPGETPLVTILKTGNVGIGTTTPLGQFSVGTEHGVKLSNGNSSWSNNNIIVTGRDSISGDYVDIRVPGQSPNNSFIRINRNGNVGINTTSVASMFNVNGSVHIPFGSYWIGGYNDQGRRLRMCHGGGDAFIDYVPSLHFRSGSKEVLLLDSLGNIGIGTTTPDYKLDVIGTIRAKEILVNLEGGADFVFEEDYKLKPIQEVYKFVKENKHLPEVPAAQEMVNNGLNMGEFQVKLLQKVEELTLYVAEQDSKIKELEKLLNNR